MEYGKEVTFPAVTICNLNPIRVSKVIDALNDEIYASRMDPLFSSKWPIRLMPAAVNELHTQKRPPAAAPPKSADSSLGPKPSVAPNSPSGNGPSPLGNADGMSNQGPGPGATGSPSGSQQVRDKRGANSSSNSNFTDIESFWQHKIESAQFYDGQAPKVKTTEIFQQIYANMSDDLKTFLGHKMDEMLYECSFNGKECSPRNFTRFFNYKYGSCYTFNSGLPKHPLQTSFRPGPLSGLSLAVDIQQDEYVGGLTHEAGLRVLIHSQSVVPFPEDEGFTVSPGFATSAGMRLVNITRLEHPYKSNCTRGLRTRYSTTDKMHHRYSRDQMTTIYAERGTDMASMDSSYVQKNLLRLDVFFQQLNYENVEEIEAQGASYLVSSIGGLAGFYIGVSVCTVCEFVQLICTLVAVPSAEPRHLSHRADYQTRTQASRDHPHLCHC
ncbi:amiloride-sensitive sodium channel subunit beta [Lingula anatina]|uniref:Amiloride-sensitive sodium channel subunit beta n=1 Tax=Lingula anatina TaxID=7574 RepID=A0A1S3KGV3_LINAN|nr:amiloride-sensitive sodium channel subunit beta [Lingula anatina]|eukprot:XP_013421868.1 amiloride-sensitive sodium channel subunit beta [Lingula anatina]